MYQDYICSTSTVSLVANPEASAQLIKSPPLNMILSQFYLPPTVTTYFPKDHLTTPGSRTQISTVQITQPFTWQDEEPVLSTKECICLWTMFQSCDFEKIFVHIKSLYCHRNESPFCTAPSSFQACQKVTFSVSSVFSWPSVWAFSRFPHQVSIFTPCPTINNA